MKNRSRVYVRLIVTAITLVLSATATAEVVDNWGNMQKDYFPGKNLEPGSFIRLTAPQRAESGAQVPFAFSIDYPMTTEKYIKSVFVFVDANPVPLTAVFHFNPLNGKAEISTRIRLETDSFVHVVAQSSDGKSYMNAIPIRASGGCGGTIGGDESAARASAGKMKMVVDKPVKMGSFNHVRLLIKHPMYTGLQRDLELQGYRPAFFINQIKAKYNGMLVMNADTFIGISEDPNIQFGFVPDKPGTFEVIIKDNEGGTFTKSIEVKEE
ncbi:MAG: quinoprotein dehydrogenase-associated SoxYZ-like carrier [Glaciimonas sp.]|nr:quinoprotein dehydrogenase-associated SoxYZ-like carrier [Glaciimonas sp.]